MFTTKNEQQVRWALTMNFILWFIHDIYVEAYLSALTDIVLSVWTFIQIYKHGKSENLLTQKLG